MRQKQQLRMDAKARRGQLSASPAEVRSVSEAVRAAVSEMGVQWVAGYSAVGSEYPLLPVLEMLEKAGYRLCLPVVIAKGQPLCFRQWSVGDALQPGALGIEEPLVSAEEVVPDIVLVPLLAYDGDGYRLGYGGGFYDRTLAALRQEKPELKAIGVAYAGQKVETLPRESHDMPLDAVVTERGVEIFSRRMPE